MRARRFRPMLDGLDRRLLLDASSGTATVAPPVVMPGDEIDPVAVIDYYGPGDPPPDNQDPTDPTGTTDPTDPSNCPPVTTTVASTTATS